MDIVELTKIIKDKHGNGLSTELFFDSEDLNFPNKTSRIFINTSKFEGSKKYPYQSLVTDSEGRELDCIRFNNEEIIDVHFRMVNKYQKGHYYSIKKFNELFNE